MFWRKRKVLVRGLALCTYAINQPDTDVKLVGITAYPVNELITLPRGKNVEWAKQNITLPNELILGRWLTVKTFSI